MDPETVSTKEYVEQRTVFLLTAFNSEYLAFLAYVLHAFFMLSAKMADSDSKQKQCHVTCRPQLNRALEARNNNKVRAPAFAREASSKFCGIVCFTIGYENLPRSSSSCTYSFLNLFQDEILLQDEILFLQYKILVS